jgi:hypothetical protein
MSTLAIIAIIVGALILLAIVVSMARRSKQQREFGRAQVEAKQEDVQHHRARAEERRTDAAVAEERAKRADVEAKLDEERAERREHELGNR